jgi:hypothetical protein
MTGTATRVDHAGRRPDVPSTSEGSVSFSLKELMRLEEERIALARDEARAEEEERKKRAEEEAFRARELEEERNRAEEDRRQEEARRDREEAARLEGMQRAIVERERVAVQEAAHAAEMDRLRKHELELVRLRGERGTSVLGARTAWSVAAALAVALGACMVTYFAQMKPEADRHLADARLEASAQSDAIGKAQRQLDELGQRVQTLDGKLHDADARAQDLERQLKDARDAAPKGGPRATAGFHPRGTKDELPKGLLGGACKTGDPLCAGR